MGRESFRHDEVLTSGGEEAGLGRKSLRRQYSSKEVLARRWRVLQQRLLIRGTGLGQE